MNFARIFVDRPIFAGVLSIVITLLGALAYFSLPVAQYPEVIPPTVVVSATYPGADARTLAETVSTPLEQEINGVEDMIYLSSSSTSDGRVKSATSATTSRFRFRMKSHVFLASRRPPHSAGSTTRCVCGSIPKKSLESASSLAMSSAPFANKMCKSPPVHSGSHLRRKAWSFNTRSLRRVA
jgi:hypothetical protein